MHLLTCAACMLAQLEPQPHAADCNKTKGKAAEATGGVGSTMSAKCKGRGLLSLPPCSCMVLTHWLSKHRNLQAADLKGGKSKAGETAAGVDSTTSQVAGAVRDAGGAIADAAPVDTDRCVRGAWFRAAPG